MDNKVSFDYDREADVMYITFGKPKPAVCEEYGNVCARVNPKTRKIVGFTIIEFSKTFKDVKLTTPPKNNRKAFYSAKRN